MLLFVVLLLAADLTSKPLPKITELDGLKIEKLEAEQRANDSQLQTLKLQIVLIQRAAKDLESDSAAKKSEEQAISDRLFKDAGLDPKEYQINLEKREFVKKQIEEKKGK